MADRGAFVIPIRDLDVMGRDVRFELTPAWLRGALEGCEMQPAGPAGHIAVHVSMTGDDVLVRGPVDVSLAIPCARCLNPVELHPSIELSLLLIPASEAAAPHKRGAGAKRPADAKRPKDDEEESDFAGEEANVDTYEGDDVVLDRFVREAILLESPIFPLCSEACEGIRPASDSAPETVEGAPTDPRLLPLLELAKKRQMKE